MTKNKRVRFGWLRVALPGGSLFLLGGCNYLSDQQLTSLFSSAVSTGLNTILAQAIAALFGGLTGTA